MTLKQLQKRINDIVAGNDASWPERNEMDVLITLTRSTPKGRYKQRYFKAEFAQGSMITVGQSKFGMNISTSEKAEQLAICQDHSA